jgi:hypothetical protein
MRKDSETWALYETENGYARWPVQLCHKFIPEAANARLRMTRAQSMSGTASVKTASYTTWERHLAGTPFPILERHVTFHVNATDVAGVTQDEEPMNIRRGRQQCHDIRWRPVASRRYLSRSTLSSEHFHFGRYRRSTARTS